MKLTLKSFLFLLLFSVNWVFGGSNNSVMFEENQAKLVDRTTDNKSIQVHIRTIPYSHNIPYKGWWGTVDNGVDVPKSVICSMTVRIEDEDVSIPLSAYCDLSNPHHVEFQNEGKRFIIILRGGDAAGAYKVEWHFKDNRLQRRRVAHSEFPNEAWEETRYASVKDNGR